MFLFGFVGVPLSWGLLVLVTSNTAVLVSECEIILITIHSFDIHNHRIANACLSWCPLSWKVFGSLLLHRILCQFGLGRMFPVLVLFSAFARGWRRVWLRRSWLRMATAFTRPGSWPATFFVRPWPFRPFFALVFFVSCLLFLREMESWEKSCRQVKTSLCSPAVSWVTSLALSIGDTDLHVAITRWA